MKTFALAAMALAAVSMATPAVAAPLTIDSSLAATSPAQVENVRWRGHHHRWHGRHHHRHSWGPVAGGLVAGALIGSAIANSQARADAVSYCSQRYRSYDPASGTYLGYDGLRHPCP